jgi:hypothetical protein
MKNRYLYEYDINVLRKYYIIIRLNIVHIKKSLEYDLHFNPTLIYVVVSAAFIFVNIYRWGFCFLYESRLSVLCTNEYCACLEVEIKKES